MLLEIRDRTIGQAATLVAIDRAISILGKYQTVEPIRGVSHGFNYARISNKRKRIDVFEVQFPCVGGGEDRLICVRFREDLFLRTRAVFKILRRRNDNRTKRKLKSLFGQKIPYDK